MSQEAIALWGLAASILMLACTLFFKGPKEMDAATNKRLDTIEREHDTVQDTVTAHTVELRHLARACEALAGEVKALRDAILGKFGNGPRRR